MTQQPDLTGKVAVVGVGHSKVYRRADVALGVLAVDAATKAIEDAGLEVSDIDGLSTTPYQPFEGAGEIDGVNIVSPEFLMQAMRMEVAWSERQLRPVGASLIDTMHAVASGQCRYAVCFRGLHSPAGRRYGRTAPETALGGAQFRAPYGLFPPGSYAILAQRYMDKYGATSEQLGAFIVQNRERALKWEHGYWYQHGGGPLTMEDYMTSRMISSPLRIHDCDIPVQVAAAFVVTTAERAKDLRHPPAYVLGTSNPFTVPTESNPSLERFLEEGAQTGRFLWRNSGIRPQDADVVNLYDGFSVLTPMWAHALGFCDEGEGFSFIAAPPVPFNTSSGNLGAGRSHGIAQIMDSVLQIMGRSGPRQVAGAETAVAVTNPLNIGSGFVFSKHPG